MTMPQHVAEDYRTTSLSLKAHPIQFFREELTRSERGSSKQSFKASL